MYIKNVYSYIHSKTIRSRNVYSKAGILRKNSHRKITIVNINSITLFSAAKTYL